VVDDDPDIREMIALALSMSGIENTVAADGIEALDQLRAGARPGVILLDLMMPRVSGAELLQSIRADVRLAEIPVVILSGAGDCGETAQALGCACLVKPVEIDDLLETVRRYVAPETRVDSSPRP
jgi:CheY-like chemotaxis protein